MSKGKRNERRAAELYEQAGFRTFRPQESKFGETDMFGLFDIMAIPPANSHCPVHLIQVKTNRASGIESWLEDADPFHCIGTTQPVFLVAYDGQGGHNPIPQRWRLIRHGVSDAGPKEEWVDERDEDVRGDGEGVVRYLQRLLGDVEAIEA